MLLDDTLARAGSDPKTADQRLWAIRESGYMAFLKKDYATAKKLLDPIAIAPLPAGEGPAVKGKQAPKSPAASSVDQRAMRLLLASAREAEDYKYALEKAKAAAAIEPRNYEWEAQVAEFQRKTGDNAAASATFAKMAASPELERAMAAADALARIKDYSGAAQIARDAAGRFPESTEVLFRLASSLERAGSPAEAEKLFLKLLDKKPTDAATLNYLGYMWADKNVHLDRARMGLLPDGQAGHGREEPDGGLAPGPGRPDLRGAPGRPRRETGPPGSRGTALGALADAEARRAGEGPREAREGARQGLGQVRKVVAPRKGRA